MKKYLMLVLAFMTLSGFGVNAYAQEQEKIIGNIPFQFIVAGETLPAGAYTVKIVDSGSELVIASWDKSVFVCKRKTNTWVVICEVASRRHYGAEEPTQSE